MEETKKPGFAKLKSSDAISGRCIVLDTETTGLDPVNGDRIIEVGCVEVFNGVITGKNLHFYVDPEREPEYEAFKVHGMDRERLIDLSGGKKFKDKYMSFESFINGDTVVIHNAQFDMGFLNMEFERLGFGPNYLADLGVFDTLHYARNLYPGGKNTLDGLCKKYKVDNSKRDLHGALLDAEILAEVYIQMVTPKNDHIIYDSIPKSAKIDVRIPIEKTAINPRLSEKLDQLAVRADKSEVDSFRDMAKNRGLEIF